MSYSLFWRSPALPYVQKQAAITVPAGAVVSNAASLRFTGKGATNYGKIQQENLLRLLENFAGGTEPDYPTVGQTWYDTTEGVLKVCVTTAPEPVTWQQLNATQITLPGDPPPTTPALGDTWFSQTGSASGILYVYTGLGRYPEQDWNATTSGYWPANATASAIILNSQTFGPPNMQYSECYIHGFTGVTPADVNGSILINSVATVLPKGFIVTQHQVVDGLIVWDSLGTLNAYPGTPYFVAHQSNDGRWFYDNNSLLVEFTPSASLYAIGRLTVAEQDDQGPPGVSTGVTWATGIPLPDMMQSPETRTNGAIGGWEQVWPTVETFGGRAEYEYLYGQLAQLIGNPVIYGGSGAEGRAIQFLTDFRTLDASMQLAWTNSMPPDFSAYSYVANKNELKVNVNSQDWDKLFSACRYAVNRLELPAGIVSDLATHPFVQDGLAPDPTIYAISGTDIRSLPTERRLRNRIGAITIFSQYQETVNVLRAAIQNRYLLKGILEQSGVGNVYNPTVLTNNQAQFSAAAASFSGTVSHGLEYRFDYGAMDMERFFLSGCTLQLVMSHTGATTPADFALQAIASNAGRVRMTANNTLVMSSSPTPSVTQAPSGLGFVNLTLPGITLATIVNGGTTVTIRGIYASSGAGVQLFVDITAGGAATGTFTVLWSVIRDTEQYSNPAPTSVYPAPLAYTASHKLGSGLFV